MQMSLNKSSHGAIAVELQVSFNSSSTSIFSSGGVKGGDSTPTNNSLMLKSCNTIYLSAIYSNMSKKVIFLELKKNLKTKIYLKKNE